MSWRPPPVHAPRRADLDRRGVPRRDGTAGLFGDGPAIARAIKARGPDGRRSDGLGRGRDDEARRQDRVRPAQAGRAGRRAARRRGGLPRAAAISRLWGVGEQDGRRPADYGVRTIGDLAALPEDVVQRLGGFRTLLGSLLREGNPIGILAVSQFTVQPFDDKHIELLTSFADQAVIAIENVRLFESVEARTQELAKSLEELRTTQDRLVQTQKLALLGQLTAGIAHEIKNPLNFVNNFSGISAELIGELQDTLKGCHSTIKPELKSTNSPTR